MKKSDYSPHLVWICPYPLKSILDAATWLNTTRELRQMNWKVTLISSDVSSGLQKIRGIDVLCIRVPEVYFIKYLMFHWRLFNFLCKLMNADVIMFHSYSVPWILLFRLCQAFSIQKRAFLVMDTRTLHMTPKNKQGWKGFMRDIYGRLMNNLGIRFADGQTAITSLMAQTLHIPPRKIWGIWPSGVDIDQFSACPYQRKWPTVSEPIRLGYVGALEYERNLLTLANAVVAANKEGMFFQLTFVGDGIQRDALTEFASKSNGCVQVLPAIPHHQVADFLSSVHVGVLPFPDDQKFRVSSPIKLFEYMAASLPILATRIPCHLNVLGEERCAFWAEQADQRALLQALRGVWQQRNVLKILGQDAACAAKGWTWHKSALKLKIALEKGVSLRGY
jgi:glycosyltransferase involved in cell wall biosynthesis